MAAYCACCGAEIGPKAEACPACGSPAHGMIPKGQTITLGTPTIRAGQDKTEPQGPCCWL